MTIYYLDYEGGNNGAAGTSFATRWQTLTGGPTVGRVSAGDTIRVMASPDYTSMGQNGQWTDGPLVAGYAVVGSTNTTPIVLNMSTTYLNSVNLIVGDTVKVTGIPGNTNANGMWKVSALTDGYVTIVNADGSNSVGNGTNSISGSFRKVSHLVVTIPTAVTKNVALCGNANQKPAWTASASVTSATSTIFKEGENSVQIDVGAGFTTGLAAYYATGTLDLSGYQQLSFWIQQISGNLVASGNVCLKLCSDVAGVTAVHTVNIPAINLLNRWHPITVDLGSAMSSSIKSIAFYVNTDGGSQKFLIDNIIACKAPSAADSLTLSSLISKGPSNGDGHEGWFSIQSINANRIVLDGTALSVPGASPQRGYAGTTENVTLYKRETIKTTPASNISNTVQQITVGGSSSATLNISGGWNRTDMSTQTGETWFDGSSGAGYGISDGSTNSSYLSIDKINFTRYNYGLYQTTSANRWNIDTITCGNCVNGGISFGGHSNTINTISLVQNGTSSLIGAGAVVQTIARADGTSSDVGVTLGSGSYVTTITQANNNGNSGVLAGIGGYVKSIEAANGNVTSGYISVNNAVCGNVTASGNKYGIEAGGSMNSKVLGGTTSNNSLGSVMCSTGQIKIRNLVATDTIEVAGLSIYPDARVYFEKYDGVLGNTVIFTTAGLIQTQSAVVHGDTTNAWKFSPTANNRNQYYPLNLPLARVACSANNLVTVSAWFQRTNTGLTGQLICKGDQIAGSSNDVTAQMTVGADTWEQVTITFTPTEMGVVEIEAQFWGGSTYSGYVGDLTITQA